MGAPQIIVIILYSLSFLVNLLNALKEKDPTKIAAGCIGSVAGTGIMVGLLLWGGFFGG